ncbi:MAG: DNA repair protein RecO [Cellvibrionaceae bacterium]|nr:DNA repair protein RecO [Cellvibrionaceae bacterium]
MEATENQAAFVLHSRPYSDSSLIVHLLSQDYGRINVLAKGARTQKSKRQMRQPLQAFTPYLLNWQGRGDLKTLTRWEAGGQAIGLQGNSLYSGLYINELLLKLLPEQDPAEDLFIAYAALLADLQAPQDLQARLRQFEFTLLAELGYGLDFGRDHADHAIVPEQFYVWQESGRFYPVAGPAANAYAGIELLALGRGQFVEPGPKAAAKRLMRQVFHSLLGGRPLKSREFIQQLQGFRQAKGGDNNG